MFGEGGGGGEGGREISAELGNCLHFWLLQKPQKNGGHLQDLRSKGIKGLANTSLRNLEKLLAALSESHCNCLIGRRNHMGNS